MRNLGVGWILHYLDGRQRHAMDEQAKYTRVWKKYIKVIGIKMKQAVGAEQQLMLDEMDFKMGGKRAPAGYSFNLEMDKGSVSNNIAGAIAARTLLDALREDTVCRELLSKHRVKINLDRRFYLRMEVFTSTEPNQ